MADKDFDNKIVKLPGSSDKPINTGKPANRQPARDIIRTKFIESATEKGFNSLMGFLIKFVIFLVIFILLWIILSRFNIGVYTPLVSFLLAILFIYLWFKPQGSGGGGGKGGPVIIQGGAPGERHELPVGKILLVLVLALVIFWFYQGAQKGYINTERISDLTSSSWLKTVAFFKDPFASVRDIGSWNKPVVEEKKVGVEITNLQKADYYSSGKPIRINGKIEIFGLEKESVDVEVGCSLMEGDKEVSKGVITIGGVNTGSNSDAVKINVNVNEDVKYDFLCKFNEGAKVEKDEKGFNVLITAKYPNFVRVERLSVDTIASFKGVNRETSSECRIGCGGLSGPVRLDLSTSSQPLTSIDSIYPLYLSLSNIKENWKGSITDIKKLEIGFGDFTPEGRECDSFDIEGNKAILKSIEIGNIRNPVQCSAQNLVKTKFSNINECIESARDKKEYDCWYKVSDEEFVEGSIPKKHYITAQLIFDYEFKSSASIVVRA